MKLTWLDPKQLDAGDLAGVVALTAAARAVDMPEYPSPTVRTLSARLQHGWDGEPPELGVHRDVRGRVTGIAEVHVPRRDNTHAAQVDVTVDPAVRRQGLGRQLFAAALERTEGRELLVAQSRDSEASIGFATALGFAKASESIDRRQDLLAIDWPRLDAEYESATAYASGYELLRVPTPTPADLLDDVVHMTSAINDAPTDDLDIEDEVFSPERIRAFETAQVARGIQLFRLVARERATGDFAGHTLVAVEHDRPWFAWQYDTSVLREHRGHRLGLLLKIGMLRWLAVEQPQLRTLDTDNAASNAHMIRVNELLGYHVIGRAIGWQRRR